MDNFEDAEPVEEAGQEQETLLVTEEIRSYIYETAKWTRFLSIVGLVFAAFLALMALSANGLMETMTAVAPSSPLVKLGAAFLTVYFLCISLMLFYPSYLLFKYSNAANTAVLYADQENFTVAMKKMKSVFKFWGIVTIVILAINVISILLTLIAKVGTA
ncbi:MULTISPECIES: hypothetical protein [Pedobacter]|uniref:Uncharacterized protein n=1 Tax=Pedobacter heparinus (strain ATCC 13125 / DSM 2366 / CIP 104194 / JCM 7457 / NBRC 12017 / NCIMB 9290 / NRRL B-14731 / HIM 762-3) TaxID=485917 RepID=C6XSX5_PEDHD|nr:MULTISPECIES: hypothetical protein [Pedobacter]ACU03536.1 hypothetical protein Phep_1321 [Pedobacter heparinus DSM 2366]MBB5438981.1 hypothetical protein [Pedobacter sp. AK017]